MAMEATMPGPGPVYPRETFSVKVEVDAVSRDEPTEEVLYGITRIDINRNGDLLLFRQERFPSVGYTAGCWIKFEVLPERMYEKEG